MTPEQLPESEQDEVSDDDDFFGDPAIIAGRYPNIFDEFVVNGIFSTTVFMQLALPSSKSFKYLTGRAASRSCMSEVVDATREFHTAASEHEWPPAFAPFVTYLFFVGMVIEQGGIPQ